MARTRCRHEILAGLTIAASVMLCAAASQPSSKSDAPASGESLPRVARMMDPVPLGVGRLVPDLALVPLTGEATTLSKVLQGKKGVVVAMTSVGCPAAMKYIPRLAKLEDEFAGQSVAFVYVNAERAETDPDMRRVVSDQRLDGPYLPDRDAAVVTALRARTTTEVFVIDAARTLVYRGAVDDQHGIGSSLPAPRHHYLKDAITAMLAGTKPTIRATWPPGCVLEVAKAEDGANTAPPTYHGEIARLVDEHCAACHTAGGVGSGTGAPFALDSFAALTARAPMVEAVVRDGIMPPWHGVRREGTKDSAWAHDRSMADADRQRLLAWLRSDRPVGNAPDAMRTATAEGTPLAAPTSAWAIGVPDLVVTTPAIKVPADGGLKHHRVFVAMPVAEATGVNAAQAPAPAQAPAQAITSFSALEFKPVEPKTFHHAVVWILEPGTPLPGPTDVPEGLQLLGTYSRGDAVLRLGERSRRIVPGSVLVADLYLTPMGKEMNTALRLGFRQSPTTASTSGNHIRSLTVNQPTLKLAAGVSAAVAEASLILDADATITALTPLLGPRGVAILVEAIAPDGSVAVLVDAPRYEWRWAIRFERLDPLTLPKGTRIVAKGVFDTTEANPNNPSPGSETAGGVRETDEMLIVVLEATQL